MSRVHPSSQKKNGSHNLQFYNHDGLSVAVPSTPKHTTLTVWKRSSMSFQGTDGFTVYDRHGRLAFRVDNYSRKNGWSCSSLASTNRGDALVLMDGSGKPLFTLKPQILSFQNQWNGCLYREDDNKSSTDTRHFVMRKPSSTLFLFGFTQNQPVLQCEAEVYLTSEGFKKLSPQPDYIIEGSFWTRNCKIRSTTSGEIAATVIRKRTTTPAMVSGSSTMVLSEEVFSLVVEPGFDPQLIMAFVVILDRICFKPFFTPLVCS